MGDDLDKTSVVSGDTFEIKLSEAGKTPPALILLMGPANQVGRQWSLTKTESLVGRSVDAEVFVDDRSVSKNHAKIMISKDGVSIIDLNSTNGTEVGGEKVSPQGPRVLANNEHIKLGNVIFKYLDKGNIEAASSKASYDRAQIDALTGIYNKRALIDQGNEIFERAKMTETGLALMMFDLDNFKMVNDEHGHPAGDYVLKELSAIITNQLRKGDFFGRYGGEEFCIIFVGSDLKKGADTAERIRLLIQKHEFKYKDVALEVTISAGVAIVEEEMESFEDLIEKADQAAYLAKKSGKNRVSTL